MNVAAVMAAIRADPDDDEPRLVWSDLVGGERGELVALQCQLARGERDAARARGLREREAELLRMHGRAWSELGGFAKRCTFRRGFVDSVVMQRGEWSVGEVLDRAPLATALVMDRATADGVEGFLRDPDWRTLPAIGFLVQRDEWDTFRIWDRLAREDLSHVKGFELMTGGPEPASMPKLPECVHLRAWFPPNRMAGVIAPWVATMRELRALHVEQLHRNDARLPSHIVELGAGWIHPDDAARTLGKMPHLARLRVFGTLEDLAIANGLPLVALDLSRGQLARDPYGLTVASLELSRLRELAMNPASQATDLLAARLGAQLELFDPGIAEYPATLRHQITGALFAETDHFAWLANAFLTPRCELDEPWLGQLAVSL